MKTPVVLALLIIVALAFAFIIFSKPAYPMSEADAKKFFLEDLKEKYPYADMREIVEIIPQTTADGTTYYQLKARVTNGMDTPCPERIHVYYDYPPKNFVAQQPEYITRNCKVCINEPICILVFPEEAIIASHTYNGTEKVAQFIKENSDVHAAAQFMDSYGDYAGVWKVRWTSASSSMAYVVVLSKSANSVIAASAEAS